MICSQSDLPLNKKDSEPGALVINLFRFYLRRGNEFKLMDLSQAEMRERMEREREDGWRVEHVLKV